MTWEGQRRVSTLEACCDELQDMIGAGPQRVVLCDLDGTLTDRDAGFNAWADTFAAQRGLSAGQRQQIADLDGEHRQRSSFFKSLVEALDLSEDADVLWAEYRRRMPSLTPAVPGVREALAALRWAGWSLAVVTNGMDDNQRGKLEATGLAEHFDAVVVSQSAGVRKPDPAIFALALDALCEKGQQLGECWVVGDDPVSDVQGGRDFGAKTCWVSGGESWPVSQPPPTITALTASEGLRHLLG